MMYLTSDIASIKDIKEYKLDIPENLPTAARHLPTVITV